MKARRWLQSNRNTKIGRIGVKATHRSSTSAAQHKTQANVRQTGEKMEEVR